MSGGLRKKNLVGFNFCFLCSWMFIKDYNEIYVIFIRSYFLFEKYCFILGKF